MRWLRPGRCVRRRTCRTPCCPIRCAAPGPGWPGASRPRTAARALKARGGTRAVHATCEAAAAADQAESDAIEAGLDAGEAYVLAAWGDWQASVPAGLVGVKFGSRAGESWHLVPAADYEGDPGRLSDYPAATPWTGHP